MEWYYAINGERRGPVSPEEMARLVAEGTVSDDVLVWRSGLPNWLPWGEISESAGLPPPPLESDGPGADVAAAAAVSQAAADETMDAEGFWAGVRERGYPLAIGDCLGRAWDLYKAGFGPCLAVTLLAMIVLMAAGIVPFLSILTAFVVSPQINAGLFWYFLRRVRGEPAEIGDLFAGYRRGFGQLALTVVLQICIFVPFGVAMAALFGIAGISAGAVESEAAKLPFWIFPTAGALGLLAGAVGLRLTLAPIIIIDRGYSAIEALKLSWRIVGKRFWTFVGLMLALVLISFAGLLAFIIGVLLVAPMYPAVIAYAYEDAWRSARGLPPAK